MPFYNSEKTLYSAAKSILVQDDIEFELLLINDFSSDSSLRIAEELAISDPRVSVLSLSKNSGGGKARNYGISHAKFEILFCFDSDDILPKGMLSKLYNARSTNQYDGACFSAGMSFSQDPSKAREVKWAEPNTISFLDDAFSRKYWPVGGVFLFTKEAWSTCKGFPEDTNFDTQGFGLRFLSHGLRALSVEGAWFYHRQFSPQESYFQRAYKSGEYSLGFLMNYLDLWPYFSSKARELCLEYNYVEKNSFDSNITKDLEVLHSEGMLFLAEPQHDEVSHSRDFELSGDWKRALQGYEQLSETFPDSQPISYLVLKSFFQVKERALLRPQDVFRFTTSLYPKKFVVDSFRENIFNRLKRKWNKIISR